MLRPLRCSAGRCAVGTRYDVRHQSLRRGTAFQSGHKRIGLQPDRATELTSNGAVRLPAFLPDADDLKVGQKPVPGGSINQSHGSDKAFPKAETRNRQAGKREVTPP